MLLKEDVLCYGKNYQSLYEKIVNCKESLGYLQSTTETSAKLNQNRDQSSFTTRTVASFSEQ